MPDSDRLRRERLVFYEEDVARIKEILEELLRMSSAKCAMLVDREGHMVTKVGASSTFDDETVSALVAGSFEATREMAKLLGEDEFSVLFHQGRRDSIQIALIGERAILAILFDDRTTVGMVRLYASEATSQLADALSAARNKPAGHGESVPEGLASSAQERLDELFGKGKKGKEGGQPPK